MGWSTAEPLTILGTDGGLPAEPVEKPYVMLAPGERVELWADFSQMPVGAEFSLNSLAFAGAEDPGGMGGMMGMMGRSVQTRDCLSTIATSWNMKTRA